MVIGLSLKDSKQFYQLMPGYNATKSLLLFYDDANPKFTNEVGHRTEYANSLCYFKKEEIKDICREIIKERRKKNESTKSSSQ